MTKIDPRLKQAWEKLEGQYSPIVSEVVAAALAAYDADRDLRKAIDNKLDSHLPDPERNSGPLSDEVELLVRQLLGKESTE